jgi:Arc/MetJ-type ribon-helix-helix transcriptional regulator
MKSLLRDSSRSVANLSHRYSFGRTKVKIGPPAPKISAPPPDKVSTLDENSKFLADNFGVDAKDLRESPYAWLHSSVRKESYELVRTSRVKYLTALAYVYALAVAIERYGTQDEVIRALCRDLRTKYTKRADLVRLLLRWAIDYGEDNERNPHRKIWSRDAAAIRYLKSQAVMPWHVLEFHSRERGGIDRWARLDSQSIETAAARDQADESKSDVTPSLLSAPSPDMRCTEQQPALGVTNANPQAHSSGEEFAPDATPLEPPATKRKANSFAVELTAADGTVLPISLAETGARALCQALVDAGYGEPQRP